MKFFAVLNRGIKPGMLLNALGHMALGMGHRLKGQPSVSVFFGDEDQVREFRRLSKKIESEQTVQSDFPHTMSGGDTKSCLEKGRNTPEVDMIYFGTCFLGKSLSQDMVKFLGKCEILKDYKSFFSESESEIKPVLENVDDGIRDKKIVMCVSHKKPLAQVINSIVLACLHVGFYSDTAKLGLLGVEDKEGGVHSNISFHPFPVLCPAKKNEKQLAKAAADSPTLVSYTINDPTDSDPLVTVGFGETALVDEIFPRNKTRMFNTEFKAKAFEPAVSLVLAPGGGQKSSPSQPAGDEVPEPVSYISIFEEEKKEVASIDKLEKLIDEAEDLAGKGDLGSFKAKIKIIDRYLSQGSKKVEPDVELLHDMRVRFLLHAAGLGNLETVNFIIKTFVEFSPSELDEATEYARMNWQKDVVRSLERYMASIPRAGI